MICVKNETIGWIGSAYFVGWTASCPIVPVLADKYGRKWIVFSSLLAQLVFYTVMINSNTATMTIAMSCLNGFCVSGRCSIAFVYLCEFLSPDYINIVSAVFNFYDGAVCLLISIWF